MDGSPLANKILPSRKAAKAASASFAEQLSSDASDFETPKKGSVTVTYGSRGGKGKRRQTLASTPSKIPARRTSMSPTALKYSSISAPPVSRARSRTVGGGEKHRHHMSSKAKQSEQSDSDEELPMTILESPKHKPQPPASRKWTNLPKKLAVRSFPLRAQANSFTASKPNLRKSNEETWNAADLGIHVWILLDKNGHVSVSDTSDEDIEDCAQRIWWPAKVRKSLSTVQVI